MSSPATAPASRWSASPPAATASSSCARRAPTGRSPRCPAASRSSRLDAGPNAVEVSRRRCGAGEGLALHARRALGLPLVVLGLLLFGGPASAAAAEFGIAPE